MDMPPRNFTDSEEEQIAKVYLASNSARAIAKAYGLSHHISITSALKRQGVEQRAPSERNRLYKLNPHVFDEIDNEHTAYWLGFLYADGYISKRTLLLKLRASDDIQCYRLKEFMQSESPVKYTLGVIDKFKKYQQAKVEFTNRHLVDRLSELGIVKNRSRSKLALDFIPNNLFNHWLRGFFDGDGSARKQPSIVFCGNYSLLFLLKEKIARLCNTNPHLMISKHSTANLYYLYYSGRIQALKVANFMYQDATIWLERKREVIDNWPFPKKRYRDERGRFI